MNHTRRLRWLLWCVLCVSAPLWHCACGGSAGNHRDSSPRGHYNNGAPEKQGSEQYTDYGVNPWTDPTKDALSTFAIDVDTGSYTIGRRKLNEGTLPPANSVRVEEYLNYFQYRYDGPTDNTEPFAVHSHGAVSPYNNKHHLMRIGLQGKRLAAEERKTVHLTFLVDTSGSMGAPDKLPLAQASLRLLVSQLKPNDTIALSTYAGSTRLVLGPTSVAQRAKIEEAIDGLRSGGGTAMASGMEAAYSAASQSYVKGHVNRVIVLSDGDANIGKTSHAEILATIAKYVEKGITMSTIGFGMGNYKDTKMEQLSNKGNGNYYYIDSLSQAKRVFVSQLTGTLQVIAKDVKIQVEFNPNMVKRYRLVGYENRDIADKDFRNDKVDAGELGAGHNVTALYEVELHTQAQTLAQKDSAKNPIAIVRLRYKTPDNEASKKTAQAQETVKLVAYEAVTQAFQKAPWSLRWASAVAGFAEILRESKLAEGWTLKQVQEIAGSAAQRNTPDHKEFIDLVKKAQALKK